MENELFDIPIQARICYEKNKGLILPEKVPYIGMGASYHAAITLRYLGIKIEPEIASEYYNYLKNAKPLKNAVLISQSGRTTDVLNCATCFKEINAIVNNLRSPLANMPNLKLTIPIHAGEEQGSATKTFINTLISLYLGHGIDVKEVLDSIDRRFCEFELTGNSIGYALLNSFKKQRIQCVIIGNGPNVGTACQAALMLSESLKLPFVGMSASQYEHGHKEAARDAVIIAINPTKGVLYEQTTKFMDRLRNVNANVFEINDTEMDEIYSPFTSILPFYFLANYLSIKLGINNSFLVGNKITERIDR